MKIMRLLMASAAVGLFGVTLLGLMLGLMHPIFGTCLVGFSVWAIFYATAYVDI